MSPLDLVESKYFNRNVQRAARSRRNSFPSWSLVELPLHLPDERVREIYIRGSRYIPFVLHRSLRSRYRRTWDRVACIQLVERICRREVSRTSTILGMTWQTRRAKVLGQTWLRSWREWVRESELYRKRWIRLSTNRIQNVLDFVFLSRYFSMYTQTERMSFTTLREKN
jgi:hypothetical protein